MRFIVRSVLFLLGIGTLPSLFAQSNNQTEAEWLPPPAAPSVQEQYRALLDQSGRNARYEAAEQVLQTQPDSAQDEYCAKLHTLLAEEAVLEQNYPLAKQHYHKVVAGHFVPDAYMEGVLLAKAQLDALAGLRNLALAEAQPDSALYWHQRYVDSLHTYSPREMDRYRVSNDKWFAICYQEMGQSDQALRYLMPHALGDQQGWEQTLDKEMVHWLVDLLRSKYGKKAYRQFLQDLAFAIHCEKTPQGARFYLQIWEDRIYFGNDSANYQARVTANPQLAGQAIAHYQRKLLNSYFYQRLLQVS